MQKNLKILLLAVLVFFLLLLFWWLLRPKPALRSVVYNVDPSMSESSIQSTLNTADQARGSIVMFAGGGYRNFNAILQFPCKNGTVYQGPPNSAGWVYAADNHAVQQLSTPAAVLNSDNALKGDALAYVQGGDPANTSYGSGCTFQDLWFNSQGLLIGGTSYSNNPAYGILVRRLTFLGFTSQSGVGGTALFIHNTSHVAVYQSYFGPNCLDTLDQYVQGNCGMVAGAQDNVDVDISNNYFDHLEEGIASGGVYTSGCSGCKFDWNVFVNWHRMPFEITNGNSPGNVSGMEIRGNLMIHPYKPWDYSFGISMACCYSAPVGYGYSFNVIDNTLIADNPPRAGDHLGYIMEMTGGSASFFNNNFSQGYWPAAPGVAVGNTHNPTLTGNVLHGPAMTLGGAMGCEYAGVWPNCLMYDGKTSVGTVSYQPIVTNTTNSQIVTNAPRINPPSGAFANPPTATISNTQADVQNYCTDDGSTPTTASHIWASYTPKSLPVTLKCGSLWGLGAAQAFPYTPPWGWAFSSITTVTYTPTGANTPTLSSITVAPASASIVVGATQQYTALCHFSDGSASACSSPTWGATTGATITSAGLATGTSAGTSTIAAVLGAISGSAALTVTSPTPVPACNQVTVNGVTTCGTAVITTTPSKSTPARR